jgi:hypothetical protein
MGALVAVRGQPIVPVLVLDLFLGAVAVAAYFWLRSRERRLPFASASAG